MKSIRLHAAALAASLLVAACGGGGGDEGPRVPGPSGAPTAKGTFTSVVSFGDSLSDLGTYTPATATPNPALPYLGGKWTTNAVGGKLWVEVMASSLSLPITPAVMGFAGQVMPCPLAVACTGYAQGGSRVTDPVGNGNSAGAMTIPVKTQIANHLAKGNFTANDLVLVWAGANDILIQFSGFVAKASAISPTDPARSEKLLTAQIEADAAVKQAALELGSYVRTEVLGKGASYVAVLNVPDLAITPLGLSLNANPATRAVVPVLSGLVSTFNANLTVGLDRAAVHLVNADASFKTLAASPSTYGFTNVTTPACDKDKISFATGGLVADGSSLFCNADVGLLVTGADKDTWLFADSIHPSLGGHREIAKFVAADLKRIGWTN